MLERDLFDFLEHTNDAAFAVTDGGEICSWNAGAEALFGFGCGEEARHAQPTRGRHARDAPAAHLNRSDAPMERHAA